MHMVYVLIIAYALSLSLSLSLSLTFIFFLWSGFQKLERPILKMNHNTTYTDKSMKGASWRMATATF